MAKLIPGVNDLTTTYPDLVKEWDYTKNGSLKPEDLTAGSNKKVWWILPYDDPKTGRHFDFSWNASVNSRTKRGYKCPYLSGKLIQPGFNDLATTHPKLVQEWDYIKNGDLTPEQVTAGSPKKIWWFLIYDDPISGKQFDFSWQEKISNRTHFDYGCPYFSGNAIWFGFNDLATTHPELIKEWNFKKNGKLQPKDVTEFSRKSVWWQYPYDDPVTNKHFDFEWKDTVVHRTKEDRGCPFFRNRGVWPGYNDLATTHPDLAKEWDYAKNGSLKPTDITAGSKTSVWWLLPYDDPFTGKHFDLSWKMGIDKRAYRNQDCPYFSGKKILKGFNDLATTKPNLAEEWDYEKNGDLKPEDVTEGSNKKVWWLLKYTDPITGNDFEFSWQAQINSRAKGYGCPVLTGKMVWYGFNDLPTTHAELLYEWDFEKNKHLDPYNITAGCGKNAWWKCITCGSSWSTSVNNRARGASCPVCASSRGEKIIKDILLKHEIPFEQEKTVYIKEYKKSYFFDFYVAPDIYIEYDGEQHFVASSYFKGKKGLKDTVARDTIKNQYCKDNNMLLLRIPFIYDPGKNKTEIEQLITDFIDTKKIPSEIFDFYKGYQGNYAELFEK